MVVYALRLGLQLALLLLVARYLGPSDYGEFAAIAALAFGLGTLSSFGMGFLVLRESARSPVSGKTMLTLDIPATFLSAALLFPLLFWLSLGVFGSGATFSVLVLIGLAELLLTPLLGLLSFRLQGIGRVAQSQALTLLPMLLRLTGIGACIAFAPGNGLELYALVHGLGAAAGLMLAGIIIRRTLALSVKFEMPTAGTLQRGSAFALMNFMTVNPSELDKALSLRLLGASETGLYALASRGLAIVTLPVVAMILSAQPRIFRDAGAVHAGTGRLIGTAIAVAFLYGLAAGALLYLAAPPLLHYALGEQYQAIGEVVAMIAMIAPFMTIRFAGGGILLALDRPLLRTGVEGIGLLLLIALALLLSPTYGMQGLIWSVLASEAAMGLLFCLSLFRRFQQRVRATTSAIDTGHE